MPTTQLPLTTQHTLLSPGDFIEDDDGEYGADLGEEELFANGGGGGNVSGKKRKDGGGKGVWVCLYVYVCD